jgi:hypothetical protein
MLDTSHRHRKCTECANRPHTACTNRPHTACTRDRRLAEAVRALRKRIQSDIPKTVMFALTLVDTLVKNLKMPFHKQVATAKFMAAMEKLVSVSLCRVS